MDTAAQDDRALVEAVRRGDRAGLEGMYRRYADRLYTYARVLVREPAAAADVVHDAFLTASGRIDQLRDPDRLRPWLYPIVRNECLRQLRERSRSSALEEAGDPVADTVDPAAGVNADQVRELVHSAAAALNPGDREVVHLAIRHDLSSVDIGAALGVPTNHAHARLSRARSQLERALGALLVARSGSRDCPALAGVLDGWQGRLTPTLRKRVARHIDGCATCGLLRREQLNPAALLSAYTAPGFLVVADTVWPRLADSVWPGSPDGGPAEGAASEGGGHTARSAERPAAGPATALVGGGAAAPLAGAAAPRTASRSRRRRRLAAGAGLLVLLVAAGTWALGPGRPAADRVAATSGAAADGTATPPVGSAGSAGPTDAAEPRSPGGSGAPAGPGPEPDGTGGTSTGAVPPGAPSPGAAGPVAGPGSGPGPTASPTGSPVAPRPTGTPKLATAFTVRASAHVRCGADTYTLVVQATGSAEIEAAQVRWTASGGTASSRAMTVDGSAARASVGQLRASALTWTVRATAADGRTAQSPSYPVTDPCLRPG
ncbi:RNA polymerase sigma factor, sigma-70 family [Micromonospora haikouensis]|uniref:RNA polymerase sigma factor, sigma-70 family n=1 Tax=Micromonospora haikouensis TaxID=686309 RepID=A0A1C4YJ11_9ACTN|nr:sigma-70 family RNA polymerase sigma factor [Micromonospora haikouensis]SCF20626.1 RNA polymerase sigma factor, sigma-70 family [Micromonospora haikouensis]